MHVESGDVFLLKWDKFNKFKCLVKGFECIIKQGFFRKGYQVPKN